MYTTEYLSQAAQDFAHKYHFTDHDYLVAHYAFLMGAYHIINNTQEESTTPQEEPTY